MHSSYVRSPSQSTTHGSYIHDSDQDAHDYTRLRLQQQLARDLLASNSYADSQANDSTVGSLGIMEGAGAMSTRRYDDVLPPSTPNLDSKLINAHFKDFSTIGVGVRTRLFPHLSNNPDDSIEVGRAGDEGTKTDKSSTINSIFRKTDRGRLSVPNAGINAQPKRPAVSPNTRARMQPTVVDESMELSSYSIGSRLQGAARRSKISKEQAAKDKLEEASKKENVPMRTTSNSALPLKRNGVTSAFLNTEKLFKDMGLEDDLTDYSDMRPESPSLRKTRTRPASKPAAPSQITAHSIKLPDMTGISDLVSSVNHEQSASKRAQYAPIASIPVPDGERDLMVALKKLQQKVEALEADKAKEKKRAEDLEKDYEQTRQLYQIEFNGRRELEAELNTRRRADSALGGEIESDQGSPRSGGDKERMKAQHKAEVKKLDGMVAAYRHRLETVEHSNAELVQELGAVTEEKDAAIAQLAKALAKNEALSKEIESLRQESDEIQNDNETLANEVERMNQMVEEYEQALEHERKMMSDKINRYREKVSRAGKVAAEATMAANEAAKLARDLQHAGTQTRVVETAKPVVQETKVETVRSTKPMQQTKPATKGKEKEHKNETVFNAAERVQQQVDAELKKMFPQVSTAAGPSKRKVSNSTIASRASGKPHVKKTRMVIEEYSESESDAANVRQGDQSEDSIVHQHMDTTFTAASISESRVHREAAGDVLPDNTLHSFVQSEGIAHLRQEIEAERRKLEEQMSQRRRAEEVEARQAQILAERAARLAKKEEAERAKKRVFIYSEKDNETTVTEHDENEAPHPFLRTSMVANDTAAAMDFGNILRDIPPRPPSRPGTQQTAHEFARRGTEEFYNEHVQEVIDRLGVHKPDLCTICHRKSAIEECNARGHSGNIVNETNDHIEIPEVVPVSKRMPDAIQELAYDGDITMRPSQPPKFALDKVVKQMEDELEHMRIDYKQVEAEFLACDPSLGRRKRKTLTHQLNEMVEQIDKKADQIYALYDVAEMVYGSEEEGSGTEKASSRRNSSAGGNRLRDKRSVGHIAI
ncbi:hypothetical protein H072_3893 [Dactylellina haptotyla CBS 200.50]|uniref:Cep57 centrosome microtubule-binding domain-containing protein n=1 Tax=Dactylellina haptotyla (strain CBS 200.50) TaxID=1284197 RepID=S8AGI2_DACHA|nr:hypothetical protein H072_3893 [Dactylellina haptotyla CBS 200.50]